MKGFRLKSISILLSLCVLFICFSACKNTENDFPELSYLTTEDTESSVNPSESEDDFINPSITELTVALPYSESTINLLFKMFYAKQTGVFPEESSGIDVDLDYLESIDIPWVIDTVLIPSDGISLTTASFWNNNSAPDLFLTGDVTSFSENDYIIPLNDYLYNNSYLNSTGINSNAVIADISDGQMLGVPHYMSVMLLAGNSDYAPSEVTLSFRPSIEEFSDYLSLIYDEYITDDDSNLVVFPRAYEMLPYLSSSFSEDNRISYMFIDEYYSGNIDSSSVDSSVDFICDLYDHDYVSYGENTADARFGRNAALWVISSSEVSMWSDYYLNNIYFSLIPCHEQENSAVLYSNLYSVCVSRYCENTSLAASFAAFISFDQDALELILRLEPKSGYFPVINNDAVWDMVGEDTYFGPESLVVRQFINDSVVCPAAGSELEQAVNSYCSQYFEGDFDDSEEHVFQLEDFLND